MKEVYYYLEKNKFFKDDDYLVVAVSGGPDSMALLDILLNIRKEINFNIVCAHVNHNMRKESDMEKIFVEEYCAKNNVIFEYMKIKEYNDGNFHSDARDKRYHFFEQLINKYKAKYLLTAHHGDDLIETVLMRLVRGSSFKGYSGFSALTKYPKYTLLRPLIFVTKDDIYNYIKENNLTYVTDLSNSKDVYTRNRYRKNILPFIKSEEDNVHRKFLTFSEELKEYYDYVNLEVKKKCKEIYVDSKINISLFKKEQSLIQRELIYNILEEIYGNDTNLLNKKHVDSIIELCNKKGSSVDMPKDIVARNSYGYLIFEKNEQFKEYDYIIKDKILLPNKRNIEVIESTNDSSNNIIRLSSRDIKLPIHVRNFKIKDKMSVKNMIGHKKVSDIFIDMKIDKKERAIYPVVVDSSGIIVWLPGLKKSKFDITKEEKCDIILRYY